MSQKTLIPGASLILTDERFAHLAKFYKDLNAKWQPHESQQEVGRAIFVEGARRIFVENGRKWGKSEFAVDLCWRLGNMIRDGQIYYFGAFQKAVREFIWAPRRLQTHGPEAYVKEINKTDMRVTFTTNTFVKCEGADEFKISKGFNPDVVILDEFADYPDEFWIAMGPNFASKDTIVIIISSPPWLLEEEPGKPVLFVRLADLWKKYQEQAAELGMKSKYRYFNEPTSKNPHISKDWLAQEKNDLFQMGMEDIYEREYEAKRVVGGGKRIIGTFNRDLHVKPHEFMMAKIERDKSHLIWLTGVDPGSSSVFGGLVVAINPFSKEVFWLDEIYEKDEDETTEHVIWPKLEAKEKELFPEAEPDTFLRVYDEAEKWWEVGVRNEFGVSFIPTQKATNRKEFGISLLRTIFRYNKGYVSERCPWLAWELENYRKNKAGQIPKLNDHLIDDSRYILHAADYFLLPEERESTIPTHPRAERALLSTPEQDIGELRETFGTDPFQQQYQSEVPDEILGEKWGQLH